ncbi:hypothetical protein So717_27470 [Roseobacter cerasinus]|uniref:Uncharacterized protein n=1 Tax=Roseobacter cerasinus TaxID=2602289 RepID=A0A640VTT2_9RHOB|nr:SDR family oxidoreductase [Roseobacter cerasinus]GFE50994.1 hypothetical protein So717_27470 [Roseobacter cerasinus]
MKKSFLIVGGTAGLGLHLATQYKADGHTVAIAGPDDPAVSGIAFHKLFVAADTRQVAKDVDRLLAGTEMIHTLIFIADHRACGSIDDLNDEDLYRTVTYGLLMPMMLVQRLKKRSDWPLKVMLVTSDAQHIPFADAPADCAAQAGLGMLGAALVRDLALGKVLVASHSGDRTGMSTADAAWTAREIVAVSGGAFKCKTAKLDPGLRRVEVTACLNAQMAAI